MSDQAWAAARVRNGGLGPDRERVARHLAAHGPTPGADLAAALGLTLDRFWRVIGCYWFALTGKGYILTPAGRREGLTDADS